MTFLPNRKPGPDRLRIRCSIHHYLPLEVSLESSSEKIRPEETIHVEYPPLRPGNTIECHGFSGGFDPSVASDPFNFERASGACKAIPCGSSTTSRVQSPSTTGTWSIRSSDIQPDPSFHRRNDPSPEPHEDFRTTSQGRIRRVPKPREASPPSRRTDGASHTDAAEPPRATQNSNGPTRTESSGIDAAARSSNSSETHPPSPGLGRRGCPSRDTSPRRSAAIAAGRTSSRERRFGAVGEGVPPRRVATGDVVCVKGPETPRHWHRLLMRSTERRSLRTAMAWAVTR